MRVAINPSSTLLDIVVSRVSEKKLTPVNHIGSTLQLHNAPNVVLDTIKRAEDSNALIIRMYEAYGGRCVGRLSSVYPVQAAYLCNILERDQQILAWDALQGVNIEFKPFKIVTVKLVFNSGSCVAM
jgi:alpha-mannosidase